jgi:hypothetical protein
MKNFNSNKNRKYRSHPRELKTEYSNTVDDIPVEYLPKIEPITDTTSYKLEDE